MVEIREGNKHLTSEYEGSCGSKDQPWVVNTDRGQKLKIEVNSLKKKHLTDSTNCGRVIAEVFELGKKNVKICSSGKVMNSEKRPKHTKDYVTKSNRIKVYLHEREQIYLKQEQFSISFEGFKLL